MTYLMNKPGLISCQQSRLNDKSKCYLITRRKEFVDGNFYSKPKDKDRFCSVSENIFTRVLKK